MDSTAEPSVIDDDLGLGESFLMSSFVERELRDGDRNESARRSLNAEKPTTLVEADRPGENDQDVVRVCLILDEQRPSVRGAALFEPRLAARDDFAGRRNPVLVEFERLVNEGKGEQAAELFQRRLLSDAFWERLPEVMKAQARRGWGHIYCDLVANAAYRPRYGELGSIDIPVLLLQGGRSLPAFETTLRALAAALGRSRRKTIPTAAHHLDGRAWRELAAALVELTTI